MVKVRSNGGWEDTINVEYYLWNLFSILLLGKSFFLFLRKLVSERKCFQILDHPNVENWKIIEHTLRVTSLDPSSLNLWISVIIWTKKGKICTILFGLYGSANSLKQYLYLSKCTNLNMLCKDGSSIILHKYLMNLFDYFYIISMISDAIDGTLASWSWIVTNLQVRNCQGA